MSLPRDYEMDSLKIKIDSLTVIQPRDKTNTITYAVAWSGLRNYIAPLTINLVIITIS